MRLTAPLAVVASVTAGLAATLSLPAPADATWQPATLTSLTNAKQDAIGDIETAVDGHGTTYAVYTVDRLDHNDRAIMLATRKRGGAWSTSQVTVGLVRDPDIAVDAEGNRVIVYERHLDDPDPSRIHWAAMCQRTSTTGDFGTSILSYDIDASIRPRVVFDSPEHATVAWLDDDYLSGHYDFAWKMMVRRGVSYTPPDGSGIADVCGIGGSEVLGQDSFVAHDSAPLLASDGIGHVVLAWQETNSLDSSVSGYSVKFHDGPGWLDGGSGSSAPGESLVLSDIAMAPSPDGVLVGDSAIGLISGKATDSTWPARVIWRGHGDPYTVSLLDSAGRNDTIALTATPRGDLAAVVGDDKSQITFARHDFGALGWGGATSLTSAGFFPALTSDGVGNLTAAWLRDSDQKVMVRHRLEGAATTWDKPYNTGVVGDFATLTADPGFKGSVSLVYYHYGSLLSAIKGLMLTDTPPNPTATISSPTTAYAMSNQVPVAWKVTGQSGTVHYDVSVRQANLSGSFTTPTDWLTATTLTHKAFPMPGGTACFAVRAQDAVRAGGWSPTKCTVVPVNDRAATASAGWSNKTGVGYLHGDYRQSTTNGATLVLPAVTASRIAVLATKGPGMGSIKVAVGDRVLATKSLAASTLQKKVPVVFAQYVGAISGPLTITVTSATGKKVLIDGIYVGRL